MNSVKLTGPGGDQVTLDGITGSAKRFEDILVVNQGTIYLISPNGVTLPLEGLECIFFWGIAVAKNGTIYACNSTHIYEITIDDTRRARAVVLAGSDSRGYMDGKGCDALFSGVFGLCIDNSGDILAVECHNLRVRKITPEGVVSTFAGCGLSGSMNGPILDMKFKHPRSVRVCGDSTYIRDDQSHIRRIHKGESTSSGRRTRTSMFFKITVCSGELFALSVSNVMYRGFPPRAFQGDGVVGYKESLEKRKDIRDILGDGDTLYMLEPHYLWSFNLAPVWSTQTHHASNSEFKSQVKALMILWTRKVALLVWTPREIMVLVFSKLYLINGYE